MNPKASKSRSNQYFELGVRGRKTGWTSKPNLKRDSDGLANIDDFFDSEPEIQEYSSEEEEEHDVSQDMMPISRRHRMTREERRQERFRHRGRQRAPSPEIEQELEHGQHYDSPGFFEEDQVNGFLPTRPLPRTPLAPKNDYSQDPVYTGKSRKSVLEERNDQYEDNYRYESPRVSRRDDVYADAEFDHAQEEKDYQYRREAPISRSYSSKKDQNISRSPGMIHDGYYSDLSRNESSTFPNRRETHLYSRDVYQNSPRKIQSQGRINRSHSMVSHVSGPSKVNKSQLKYPESSNGYEDERYNSPRAIQHQVDPVDYERGQYPRSDRKIRKSLSYPEMNRVRPLSRNDLVSSNAAEPRPQSRASVHKSPRRIPHSPVEYYDDNHRSYDPYRRNEVALYENEISHSPYSSRRQISPQKNSEYRGSNYGTPKMYQRSGGASYAAEVRNSPMDRKPGISTPRDYAYEEHHDEVHDSYQAEEPVTYEQEIARSISSRKSKIASARSQKIAVQDIHQSFEGEEYNDFPAPEREEYFNGQEQIEPVSTPIKDPKPAKRGRPKGKKNVAKSIEEKQPVEKREKKPIKKNLYPQAFKIDDQDRDENGLRKSKRVKIAPLAYWKNEKIVYGRRDSGYCPVPVMKEVIRVESDTENKSYKRKSEGKKDEFKVEKTDLPVLNFITQKEEDQQIVVTPDMIDPRTVGAGDYRFQKVFSEGEFIASGVLYLPKGSQKPNKNSNSSAMIFVVMAGQVQVQIHKTIFTVGTGAQFFVPRGNQYRISNSGHREARLFFCHGKEVNNTKSTV